MNTISKQFKNKMADKFSCDVSIEQNNDSIRLAIEKKIKQ